MNSADTEFMVLQTNSGQFDAGYLYE